MAKTFTNDEVKAKVAAAVEKQEAKTEKAVNAAYKTATKNALGAIKEIAADIKDSDADKVTKSNAAKIIKEISAAVKTANDPI